VKLRALGAIGFALAFAAALEAHDSRPILVEISEAGPNRYSAQWKVPTSVPPANIPEILLPAGCAQQGAGIAANGSASFLRRRTFECSESLANQTIRIRYPVLNPSLPTLFRMKRASGEIVTKLVGPAETSWIVPATPTRAGVAREYAALGVRHILEGVDHLLFVLGLLLIVRDRWTLLKTITAFTAAHSVTLAIATLGYASAPLGPLNTAIALSILFLGPEVIRRQRGQTSFTIRRPWIVAFAFGLLHGFGFASGLAGVGLPSNELPLALLFFNIGVEIGQVGIVLIALLVERALRILETPSPRWAQALPGYAVGSLGAFWTIQRAAMMFTGR
jgi:hydrogenase/urease accessory protein HupE